MKKIITLIALLVFATNYATDRLVDPTLSSGNGTTIFTTITAAINAAVNGDRIIIAANTYNDAALTIGKSLQIMPQTPGTTINFNANITIAGFPGMKLEITGVNLGIYNFNSNSIVSGSYTNRAKTSIIECSAANANFDNEFYELNLLKNIFTSDVNLKYGNVVLNSMSNLNIWDETQTINSNSNRIIITNNTIRERLVFYNDDNKFIITNNNLNNILIKRWDPDNTIKNIVTNNEFVDGASFGISIFNVPFYNIVVSNNKFIGSVRFLTNTYTSWGAYYASRANICSYDSPELSHLRVSTNPNQNNSSAGTEYVWNWNLNATLAPDPNISGFFEWSYNGIDYPYSVIIASNQPLAVTRIIGQQNDVNGGNPNHDYYDIDLTINDRGINGGPYSQLNYNAPNPNNSKAFIFDLDIPTDLFPTQTVDIKAKGYHKN